MVTPDHRITLTLHPFQSTQACMQPYVFATIYRRIFVLLAYTNAIKGFICRYVGVAY